MAFDIVGNFTRGLQGGQQLQEYRDMRNTRNQMRELLAGGIPTGRGEREALVSSIAQVDPRQAMDWGRYFAGMDANALARTQAEAPFVVGALSGARDQSSYDRGRAMLAEQGIDVAGLPDVYDPSGVNLALQGYRYAGGLQPKAPTAPAGMRFTESGALEAIPGYAEALGVQAEAKRRPFEEELRLRTAEAPKTTINTGPGGIDYGKPPKGTAWARNPDGSVATQPDPATGFERPVVVPIAGGAEERERQAAETAEEAKKEARERQAGVVLDEIDRVERLIDESLLPTTGMGGQIFSRMAGTGAADIDRILDTIRANVGFDKLQQMREASPTGGALGQVSENENRLLQSVLGSLDQSLSEDEFRYNLRRLKDTFLDVVHGPGNRPTARGGEGEAVTMPIPEGVTEEDIEFTMEKHSLSREEVLRRLNAP